MTGAHILGSTDIIPCAAGLGAECNAAIRVLNSLSVVVSVGSFSQADSGEVSSTAHGMVDGIRWQVIKLLD